MVRIEFSLNPSHDAVSPLILVSLPWGFYLDRVENHGKLVRNTIVMRFVMFMKLPHAFALNWHDETLIFYRFLQGQNVFFLFLDYNVHAKLKMFEQCTF